MFSMTNRDDLLSIISDMNKDINGTRPSLASFNSMTETELRAEIERLQPMVDEAVAHEKMIDAKCITLFNDEITTFIQQGAADRATAIRWFLQTQDMTSQDADTLCYNFGINPFVPAGKAIFDEVEAAVETP